MDEIEALGRRAPAQPPDDPGDPERLRRSGPRSTSCGAAIWENKGEPVGPRPPSILVPEGAARARPPTLPDPRTRLARWLASPEHPLTARVLVNRLWQHHFGIGLVKTVNDFGTRGDRPSHPELLDWLAASLVEGGWRLKPIHRLIVLSSTYRQSGRSPTRSRGRSQRTRRTACSGTSAGGDCRPRRSATRCSPSPGG